MAKKKLACHCNCRRIPLPIFNEDSAVYVGWNCALMVAVIWSCINGPLSVGRPDGWAPMGVSFRCDAPCRQTLARRRAGTIRRNALVPHCRKGRGRRLRPPSPPRDARAQPWTRGAAATDRGTLVSSRIDPRKGRGRRPRPPSPPRGARARPRTRGAAGGREAPPPNRGDRRAKTGRVHVARGSRLPGRTPHAVLHPDLRHGGAGDRGRP